MSADLTLEQCVRINATLREALDRDDANVIGDVLQTLRSSDATNKLKNLSRARLGRTLYKLQQHKHPEISATASDIVKMWKALIKKQTTTRDVAAVQTTDACEIVDQTTTEHIDMGEVIEIGFVSRQEKDARLRSCAVDLTLSDDESCIEDHTAIDVYYTAMRYTGIEDMTFWKECFGHRRLPQDYNLDDSEMYECICEAGETVV